MKPDAEITIRSMLPTDREAVIDLLWALNLFENTLTHDRALERSDAEACLVADEDAVAEQPGGALLVADVEGKVVGFLALSMNRGVPFVRAELRGHGHVLELIVAEDQRGKGIGQALLTKAEEITKAVGYRVLLVGLVEENTAARNAYTKFGFRPLAREMIKRLDQP